MNSVLAFVSDDYRIYSSEASASEGEHPFVCRSVCLSVCLCPFHPRELGWPVPSWPLWLPNGSDGLPDGLRSKSLASAPSCYPFLCPFHSYPLKPQEFPSSLRPHPLGSPLGCTSRPAQVGRKATWFGVFTPGIPVLRPAATFLLLPVVPCPPHHLSVHPPH